MRLTYPKNVVLRQHVYYGVMSTWSNLGTDQVGGILCRIKWLQAGHGPQGRKTRQVSSGSTMMFLLVVRQSPSCPTLLSNLETHRLLVCDAWTQRSRRCAQLE